MELTGFDIVLLVIVGFAALRGAIRGFVKELLSMASVILGVTAAVVFSGWVAVYLEPYVGAGPWAQIVAFIGIFLVVYVVVKLFERAFSQIIDKVHLESLDHALGLFLGTAEGILLVFLIIMLIQIQPVFEVERLLEQSEVTGILLPLLPYVQELVNGVR